VCQLKFDDKSVHYAMLLGAKKKKKKKNIRGGHRGSVQWIGYYGISNDVEMSPVSCGPKRLPDNGEC
jgi:hypothetical protein